MVPRLGSGRRGGLGFEGGRLAGGLEASAHFLPWRQTLQLPKAGGWGETPQGWELGRGGGSGCPRLQGAVRGPKQPGSGGSASALLSLPSLL